MVPGHLPGLPPMTDPTTPTTPTADPSQAETVAANLGTNVGAQLRTRVVREARRETWFVVNEGTEDVATLPIELRADAALRRVEVNGEASEFTADEYHVLVRPRRPLRAGAGTIVICHFR
ncbi:MAG: hypothetical protein JWM98_1754 [Thermoleophilia bacterium]|nr:hypothetical protein [Thermoleophilia bacterium]